MQASRMMAFPLSFGFFAPLRTNVLLAVLYAAPQPGSCNQHVLWFYVSNEKQLHLHQTCCSVSRSGPAAQRGGQGTMLHDAEPGGGWEQWGTERWFGACVQLKSKQQESPSAASFWVSRSHSAGGKAEAFGFKCSLQHS